MRKLLFLGITGVSTLFLLGIIAYTSSPTILHKLVQEWLEQAGCESSQMQINRPGLSQFKIENIELSNCSAIGIQHLQAPALTLKYSLTRLIFQQHIESAQLGPVTVDFVTGSGSGYKALAMPGQLIIPDKLKANRQNLPFDVALLDIARINIQHRDIHAQISGSIELNQEQITANFNALWYKAGQPQTPLTLTLNAGRSGEFYGAVKNLKDEPQTLYEIAGKLSISNEDLVLTAHDGADFYPLQKLLQTALNPPLFETLTVQGTSQGEWRWSLPTKRFNKRSDKKGIKVNELLAPLTYKLNITPNLLLTDGPIQRFDGTVLAVLSQPRFAEGQDPASMNFSLYLKDEALTAGNSHFDKLESTVKGRALFSEAGTELEIAAGKVLRADMLSISLHKDSAPLEKVFVQNAHISLAEPISFIVKNEAQKQPALALLSVADLVAEGQLQLPKPLALTAKHWSANLRFQPQSTASNSTTTTTTTTNTQASLDLELNNAYLSDQPIELHGIKLAADINARDSTNNSFDIRFSAVSDEPYFAISGNALTDNSTHSMAGDWTLQPLQGTDIKRLSKIFTPLLPVLKKLQVGDGNLTANGQFSAKKDEHNLDWQEMLWEGLSSSNDNAPPIAWQTSGALQLKNASFSFKPWVVKDATMSASFGWSDSTAFNAEADIFARSLDGGLELTNIETNLQLNTSSTPFINVQNTSAQAFGGTVTPSPFILTLDPLAGQTQVELTGLQLGRLLKLQPKTDITGSGTIDGLLPIEFDNNTLFIHQGYIQSRQPGGHIAYNPNETLFSDNGGMGMAMQLIQNFQYRHLRAGVDLANDGTLLLDTTLNGSNPDWLNGQPIDFNIHIEQNVLNLLRVLQVTENVTDSLDSLERELQR